VRADLDSVFADSPEFQRYEWESERLWRAKRDRLLKERKANSDLWIPPAYLSKHRPDAVVHFTQDDIDHHIAIEVQLSVKTESWFSGVWNNLLRHYEAVWYYVSAKVKQPLLVTLKKWQQEKPGHQGVATEHRQHIVVYDLEQIL
jgi:hypothetical protein